MVLTTDLRPVSAFLFSYDGSHWGVEAAKQALLSAGVTLGAGLGVAMSLGAQAPQGLPWARSVIAVAMLDTAFLLVTAIIASALLFEVNVAPSEGLAAVFVALPYAFVNVPMGEIYGTLIFLCDGSHFVECGIDFDGAHRAAAGAGVGSGSIRGRRFSLRHWQY